MNNDLYLCFINHIGEDSNGNQLYELLFSEDKDNFFGEDFEYKPCCLVNQMVPFPDAYQEVRQMTVNIKLTLIQESCCCSFTDCQDGIIPLAFAYGNNDELLIKLDYGMTLDETEEILAKNNILLT